MLGIRPYYKLLAKLSGDPRLPSFREPIESLNLEVTKEEVETLRENSGYFQKVNFARVTVYSPWVVFFAWKHESWILTIILILCAVHLITAVVEPYKALMCERLLLGGAKFAETAKAKPNIEGRTKGYFVPAKFETVEFYKFIGMERFRKIMTSWTDFAKLSPLEKEQGKKATYIERPNRQQLEEFVRSTEYAEIFHLAGGLVNLPFLIYFIIHPSIIGILLALGMLYMDIWCSLLQRYHRVRMWKTLQRLRDRGRKAVGYVGSPASG